MRGISSQARARALEKLCHGGVGAGIAAARKRGAGVEADFMLV
jgi:hypothetical protein